MVAKFYQKTTDISFFKMMDLLLPYLNVKPRYVGKFIYIKYS